MLLFELFCNRASMQLEQNETTDAEVARIKRRIQSLIQEHFDSGSGDLYLSRLGAQLGGDRILLEKLTGRKLSEFVRNNFDYEIGRGGQKNNVLFLVAPGAIEKPSERPVRRYLPRFWAAFAVPLSASEQRHINLVSMRFGPDPAILGGANEDVRPIPDQYIAHRNASGSAAETAARIEAWLDSQQLDAERFAVKRQRADRHGSVLDALLQALSTEDLKRISLPLDIVKTLSERRS
jgi:hypothetical protein